MDKFIPDGNIHDGHRARMRAKLLSHGRSIFDTYELLEMLLYYSVPYRDTNPISKRLLYAFGGLDGVLRADKDALMTVHGVGEKGAKMLSSVNRLSEILGAEMVCNEDQFFSGYNQVGEYLTDYFRGCDKRCVVAMFFDSSMRLLKLKKLYDLDYESGAVRSKPFIDEAVSCNAAVIISAHNHPFSSCYPTVGDRETNYAITDALTTAGFVHAEHYVISGEYYMGIGAHKRFAQSRIAQMPEVKNFADSCRDEEVADRRFGEPQEVILPDEAYNKADADFFGDLLTFADAKGGRDTALTLLKRYRTIENVLTESAEKLKGIVGEKIACYIKLLGDLASRRVTDRFEFGKPHCSAEIADYFKAVYIGESVEKVYLMTFDQADRASGCHLLSEGTIISSDVLPRKAIEKAVSSFAKSVVIAHNHPFGTTRPSADDVNMTAHLANIFLNCDITMREHYIVARQLCNTVHFQK